ncbi:penicillin-insensitive murein endopeptidase [Qingshengfaniella alkalisoli]|uniref:Penicillin-insensitive murein endopeptidase n=1 Tax=Qingshengfaniella alkalisoli TaxID=2599296 RepID=A0A5B8IWR6_9RHOB|nr:penicillin-insensitive murein endopeptidase [Qingshengfaniella alkalisoli]QDY70003.1 penicillin-insensitive murein endopeptidase [Qingshengfaniella alkalisoli]
MIRRLIALTATIAALATPTFAQQKANQLFGAARSASPHQPAAFGSYSRGCASGLVQLPETGPTWQAMRLSRNRNWGHPDAIRFIQRLSEFAALQPGWNGLYIGDISQPRGGPMLSGHASHQLGLDIDIWMRPANNLQLSRQQRENISSINVRSADQRSVNGNYSEVHRVILQSAAMDPAVDRIFVTPPVKIALCQSATSRDKNWLQKIRPLYGHNYHFHVRLKCPKDSPACQTQTPSVRELSNGGSGCDETLMWWVTDYLNPPKQTQPSKPAPKKKGARDFVMADLPQQCSAVLAAR